MNNVESVQHIYSAFSRGEVAAILERLSDSVEWEYGINSTEVPWLQPRRGRAEVMKFFETLGGLEFHRFEPKAFLAGGEDVVVALIDLEMTVKATGERIVEEDEVHIWHLNKDGQVSRFRHRSDTYQHEMAYRGKGMGQ